jgi:uncharacterized protein (DUF433 family)
VDRPDEQGVCSGNPPTLVSSGPDGEGWIVGTRVYAWQVAAAMDRLGSVDAVAGETGLTPHQVRVAMEWAERSGLD